jgi:hypothetical protein
MERKASIYQEQHELGRDRTLCCEGGGMNYGSRQVRMYIDIDFERNCAFCRIVTICGVWNILWGIDNGGFREEIIRKQIEALDSPVLEGRIGKVGLETRRHDETEVGAR